MPPIDLIFGINSDYYVVLDKNNYDYRNDKLVMKLLKQYKKIQFGNNYNSTVDWIPHGITDINFGLQFNKPLENLPLTIKNITFQQYGSIGYILFNQPLDYLPYGLETLTMKFGLDFNYPLNNLPQTLKMLSICCGKFYQPLNNLPQTLEVLYMRNFDYNNTYYLPQNLKVFEICEYECNINDTNDFKTLGIRNLRKNYPNVKFNFKY